MICEISSKQINKNENNEKQIILKMKIMKTNDIKNENKKNK